MQQAPEYREQDQVRRDYVPQQPGQAYQGRAETGDTMTSARQGASRGWSDWVRWGPIWSGFFTIVSVLAILGALGTGIALTVWGANPNNAFAYGWSILTGIIAYFLGGWITARSAGVGGTGAALLNAGLTWALSLVAIIVVVIFGAGNAFGFIGGNLTGLLRGSGAGPSPGMVSGAVAQTAWITFATMVIGLILALIGGLVGAQRGLGERPGRRTAGRRAF
jgi:hypothetical protein